MLMNAFYLLQGVTDYKTTSRILAALRGEAGEAAVLQARTMAPGARLAPFASWNSRFQWPHDRGFSAGRQFPMSASADSEIQALTRGMRVGTLSRNF